MKKFEIVEYILPAHWASALINADTSGLSDDEEKELDDAMRYLGQGKRFGNAIACTDEPQFRVCHNAAGVLACDCLTFTFPLLPEKVALDSSLTQWGSV